MVLHDVEMPTLGGEDIMKFIRQHPALLNTRVVFHSDRSHQELQGAVERCHADGYIVKTGDEAEFLRAVNACLSSGGPGSDRELAVRPEGLRGAGSNEPQQ